MKIILLFVQLVFCIEMQNNNEILPPMGGNPSSVTVSGYSSGGYMAQ